MVEYFVGGIQIFIFLEEGIKVFFMDCGLLDCFVECIYCFVEVFLNIGDFVDL